MSKRPVAWAYACDICGDQLKNSFSEDLHVAERGWVVAYPQEPWDENDCVVLCPKHKHPSNIPEENTYVLGCPTKIIQHGSRLLEHQTKDQRSNG